MLKRWFIFLSFFCGSMRALADGDTLGDQLGRMSLGQLAEATAEPINMLTKIFEDVSLVAGICFIVGALLQYRAHRINPSQVRLGAPIFLLILGVVLILLPFVGNLTSFHPAMVSV